MNREQAIAYKEVHDKCGMEVLRKLTPQMSDDTRAVMLEWAERGGVVETSAGSVWFDNPAPTFFDGWRYRLRPEPPRMAFVEGPCGRYEYPEPLKELGSLDGVWVCGRFCLLKEYSPSDVETAIRRRIAHSTREAAEAHRRAEILARGGEV